MTQCERMLFFEQVFVFIFVERGANCWQTIPYKGIELFKNS